MLPSMTLVNKTRACWLILILLLLVLFPIAFTTKLNPQNSLIYNRINPNLIVHNALNKATIDQRDERLNKSGYGIVYTGNVKLFHLIYVSISILEYMHFTSYPIEIFINGVNYQEDMLKCHNIFIKSFSDTFPSIQCFYMNDNQQPVSQRFSYKILALLRCSFQHTLFLDDDNILIQSPSILFDSIQYQTYHAIFWTDFWGKNCEGLFEGGYILYEACLETNGIYNILNQTFIKYDENNLKYTQSQEAAQLVIDTVKYYETLNDVLYCTESNQYQTYLHGDKDCFRFMFLERNNSFYYTPIMPQYVGFTRIDEKGDEYFYRHSLLQFWESKENIMFIHQTKWIEPMDHKLWQYYQEMIVDWTCVVHNGQDHIFPFPMEDKYVIIETKTGKSNGELIYLLEDKWIEFWLKYDSLSSE